MKVYIIGPRNGPYKIGYSENPSKRLADLQIGNHQKLVMHFEYQSDQARDIELTLHRNLRKRQIIGEWFDESLDVIKAMINGHENLSRKPARIVYRMSAETFRKWLVEMKTSGKASTDKECAALLGVQPNSIVSMKKSGADVRTALACQVLLEGMTAYA